MTSPVLGEVVVEVLVEALVQVLKVVRKDWAVAYMHILVSCILLKRLYIYIPALATQIYNYDCMMPKYGLVDGRKMPIL